MTKKTYFIGDRDGLLRYASEHKVPVSSIRHIHSADAARGLVITPEDTVVLDPAFDSPAINWIKQNVELAKATGRETTRKVPEEEPEAASEQVFPRDRYLIFRVSPVEARQIREAASTEGKNVSEYIRGKVL